MNFLYNTVQGNKTMKAIVFIDVQNDFIDGTLKNEKAIEILPKIVEFAKSAVEGVDKDTKLYATLDTHEETKWVLHSDTLTVVEGIPPISGYMKTLEGQKLPVEHCIEGTKGWEIHDDLYNVIKGKCTFVTKPTFGSFDLAEIISEDFETEKLDEIIICGYVTSICVASNAVILRAKFPNTKITVKQDLCAGVTEKDHDAAIEVLKMQQIDIG